MTLEDLDARLRRIERKVGGLMSASEIAAWASVSESTVYNRRRELGIPWRNIHGGRWTNGDGPKRISLSEWKGKGEQPTRRVKREADLTADA